MSKKTKKNKKDIPVITWVDHDDVDDWIENNLQNMFRPTSSSSQHLQEILDGHGVYLLLYITYLH